MPFLSPNQQCQSTKGITVRRWQFMRQLQLRFDFDSTAVRLLIIVTRSTRSRWRHTPAAADPLASLKSKCSTGGPTNSRLTTDYDQSTTTLMKRTSESNKVIYRKQIARQHSWSTLWIFTSHLAWSPRNCCSGSNCFGVNRVPTKNFWGRWDPERDCFYCTSCK